MLEKLRKDYLSERPSPTVEELQKLREELSVVEPDEVCSLGDGKDYLALIRYFRGSLAEVDKLHGENYLDTLTSLFSVGEDGLYAEGLELHFLFELIQNVDDCNFPEGSRRELEMQFKFADDQIVLTYDETGFRPFDVFAITGIAEKAKNVQDGKDEIGEKGIGFKSVFGFAQKVRIQSGWFSFELKKDNFTVPEPFYEDAAFQSGTVMTLFLGHGKTHALYRRLKEKYCREDALFAENPLLFLNRLTRLRMYYDGFRSMEFSVTRPAETCAGFTVENNVSITVKLLDSELGRDTNVTKEIRCTRYIDVVHYSREACQSRWPNTRVGIENGKEMKLQAVFPSPECREAVNEGALYSFLPTRLRLCVPLACHAPFKLAANREFVDSQDNNRWFKDSLSFLSAFLNKAFRDWSQRVGENIVFYLPSSSHSLFREERGEQSRIAKESSFEGNALMQSPLFRTADGGFHSKAEIICFDSAEHISDPVRISRLLSLRDYLFIPPTGAEDKIKNLGLRIKQGVLPELFAKAMKTPNITAEALTFLDDADFQYTEKEISGADNLNLTLIAEQIREISKHDRLWASLRNYACERIKGKMRPNFSFSSVDNTISVAETLHGETEFDDFPNAVQDYFSFCGQQCFLLELPPGEFLPCHNGLILAAQSLLQSLTAFCECVDKDDSFSIRMKVRRASKELDSITEDATLSDEQFLRKLRQSRLTIKEALGKGYQRYIELIVQSGTNVERFLQELLQNADDCHYPSGKTPSFRLTREKNALLLSYNETGFRRENLRAITAIGESTKKALLSGANATIGEKGIGFKTVFAMASKVEISSGHFHFCLTDKEPTIPRKANPLPGYKSGTLMRITLKGGADLQQVPSERVRELCRCLRNLQDIEIDGVSLKINEPEGKNQRIIRSDKFTQKFTRYIHEFPMADKNSGFGRIICYVPENSASKEYPLYVGLPTNHRLNIPMVINAPGLKLNTPRERIQEDAPENARIREELYRAILKVMEKRKTEDGADILRFVRILPQRHGNLTTYENSFFDSNDTFLNHFAVLTQLQDMEILPTFEKNRFVSAQNAQALLYPAPVNFLFRKKEFAGVSPQQALNIPDNKDFQTVLNALECRRATFEQSFPILEASAEKYMHEEEFRNALYEYLKSVPNDEGIQERIQALAILPVYNASGATKYVSWIETDGSIYVKKGADRSPESYYILNEKILPKTDCERFLGENVNEMNPQCEKAKYQENLEKRLHDTDMEALYSYLLAEYRMGALEIYDTQGVLLKFRGMTPLKNQMNEITDTPLFICEQPDGYFPSKLIRRMTVHKECEGLAGLMQCRNLRDICYDDISSPGEVTEDDAEMFQDSYFVHGGEILRGFYDAGFLSDDVLETLDMEYWKYGASSERDERGKVPEEPLDSINDIPRFWEKIRERCRNPARIYPKKCLQTVRFVDDGKSELRYDTCVQNARQSILERYAYEPGGNRIVCQMCGRIKRKALVEARGLLKEPEYFFEQMRVVLCLDCGKRFEEIRKYPNFLQKLKEADTQSAGRISIPVTEDECIIFTAKHLAEIQEILRSLEQLL